MDPGLHHAALRNRQDQAADPVQRQPLLQWNGRLLQKDHQGRRTRRVLQRCRSSNSGTVTPLIGIGFQASAMFFTYEFSKRFFGQFKENPSDRLPLKYIFASGLVASLPTSLIAVNPPSHRPLSNTPGSGSKSKSPALNSTTDPSTQVSKSPGSTDSEDCTADSSPAGGEKPLGKAAFS